MATSPTAATQQDIQNSEKLLDLSNQLIDSINERKKLLKGINAEETAYFSTVKQQQKLSQDIAANAEKYLGYQIKSKDLDKQKKAAQDNANKANLLFFEKINGSDSLATKLQNQRNEALQKAFNINKQIKAQKEQIDKIDERNQNLQISKNRAEREGNINLAKQIQLEIRENQRIANNKEKYIDVLSKQFNKEKDIAKTAREVLENEDKAKKARQEELAFLERNLHIRKQIEKSTGLLGGITKAISKIPGIGQYLNADEAIEEMEKYAAKIEETGGSATSFTNRFKIGLKGVSTLAKGLVENLKSPEAIFTFIISQALKANAQSVQLGKSLGFGADKADKFRENLADIARSSTNINVTTENLVESFNQLSEATGGVANYSADTLETQVMLTKQFGLTGDEAAGIYKFSVLTGKSSSQVNDEMAGAFASTRNMVKGSANFKTTMAEVAKTSGQLAANFRNNPAAITAAVVQAQALGTTLEDAKNQGRGLLDFESSIENELKAELLTGQQMNLERARAAALQGDQVTVMKELNNQGMTLEKFQNMNVLAQESFAEALGTSADKLADQLKKQKIAQEQGKSLAEITKEEALEAEKRQSVQDKFNAAILKLQDFFGNLVAGPVGQFLEILTDILPVITAIAAVYGTIALISKSMMIYEKMKLGFQISQRGAALGYNAILLARQALMGGELAKAIGIAAAYAIANPFQALLGLAVAAAAGALITKLAQPAGDMISPADGKTQVSTKEGGLFELSPNDDLLAGPGIASKGGGKGGGVAPVSIDLTPMIIAINEVKAAIDRLYSKDTSIKMDSTKVGTTLTQGSTKTA